MFPGKVQRKANDMKRLTRISHQFACRHRLVVCGRGRASSSAREYCCPGNLCNVHDINTGDHYLGCASNPFPQGLLFGFGAVVMLINNADYSTGGTGIVGGSNMVAIHLAEYLGGDMFMGFIFRCRLCHYSRSGIRHYPVRRRHRIPRSVFQCHTPP